MVSISRSISVTDSTWLAALVVISNVKGSPAVWMVNTESVSTIPPDVAEVWLIFSPVHLLIALP